MNSSGVISSNISYIQLAFNSLHTNVLTFDRMIEYLMMIWDSGRGCSKKDAEYQVNVALNAKNPSIVLEDGLIKRWNNQLTKFDDIERNLRKNREPILLTPELQKKIASVYRDSRFIVLNGKIGNKDAQYIILSEWQLLNDLVHRYMFNNKLIDIPIFDVIKLVKSHYGINESNVLFFPKVDSRFKVTYRRIKLNDYENPPLEYNVAASEEILNEIKNHQGVIIEYLKRNRETHIKIREIIQKYFKKQPYENIFSAYYEGLCRVLKEEPNIVIANNTFMFDDSSPEVEDFNNHKQQGKDTTKGLSFKKENEKESTDVNEELSVRKRVKNRSFTIRLSTLERKKSLFHVPPQLLDYFIDQTLKVRVNETSLILKVNNKNQAGSNSFGDLLFDYRVKPGQKLIFNGLKKGEANLLIEPYTLEDKLEAERLDKIKDISYGNDHISARSLLVNYLSKSEKGCTIAELVEMTQKEYPFSPKTIKTILYKYPYFIQNESVWTFSIEHWNSKYEEDKVYDINEELSYLWSELVPNIYDRNEYPAPHFFPYTVKNARVVIWGGNFPLNKNQEINFLDDGVLVPSDYYQQKFNGIEFTSNTAAIYEKGRAESSTRLNFDQKVKRFFLLSGIYTTVFSIPTFPALRLPNRLKGSTLTKLILSGRHKDSERLVPLLLEQYRMVLRFLNQSDHHVTILNFDETEYLYFLYAILGFSKPIERKLLVELLEERQMPIREEKKIIWRLDQFEKPFFNIGSIGFERSYQIAGELFKRYDGEEWKTVKMDNLTLL
ncbi:hypothetical protein [Exiguobacterium sp. s46]|uniref:hypothetical protein n=1 Tax=Exiguobacterium sp. s46 TaxID=2751200 RepID=UPI001BE8F3D4|nr:hypothetical protein [Exiguobacterium sp. s46]